MPTLASDADGAMKSQLTTAADGSRQRAKPMRPRIEIWAVQEFEALRGLWQDVHERYRVARRARSVSELLRDQWDLIPASSQRVRANYQRRRLLIRNWLDVPLG